MNKGGTEVTVFMIAQSVTLAESLQVLGYKDYALIMHLLVSCILSSLMESLSHQLTVHSVQRLCIKNTTKCTQKCPIKLTSNESMLLYLSFDL